MITTTFIIIIVVFSVFCFYDRNAMYKYMFHPYSIKHNREHYRFLTHAFIHGDTMHLAFNLFALYMFGYAVEESYYRIDGSGQTIGMYTAIFCKDVHDPDEILRASKLGKLAYLALFTGGIYAASITEYFKHRNNPSYSSLGASGAIEAIIFSYIIIEPFTTLYLFFLPMPAWLLGIVFLGGSYYLSKRKTGDPDTDRIGHEAHFWGAIFGVIFTIVLKPSLVSELFSRIF
jgi:membrane associated rhomboid family serine protease